MAMITQTDATRLAKICGMLGSNHDGERAAAALKADSMVRDLGLTWQDVIAPTAVTRPAPPPKRRIDWLDAQPHNLLPLPIWTDWESEFLESVQYRSRISPKQWAIITRLREQASRWATLNPDHPMSTKWA